MNSYDEFLNSDSDEDGADSQTEEETQRGKIPRFYKVHIKNSKVQSRGWLMLLPPRWERQETQRETKGLFSILLETTTGKSAEVLLHSANFNILL